MARSWWALASDATAEDASLVGSGEPAGEQLNGVYAFTVCDSAVFLAGLRYHEERKISQ